MKKLTTVNNEPHATPEAGAISDTPNNTTVSDDLNRLFNICRMSAEIYRLATGNVESHNIRWQFMFYAQQRAAFAIELAVKLIDLGGEPWGDTTVETLGNLHHLSMQAKSTIKDGDERAILIECERVEDAIVDIYDELLQPSLHEHIRDMLVKQSQDIRKALKRIRELTHVTA